MKGISFTGLASLRIFFLLNFAILGLFSYSLASNTIININDQNYNFDTVQCSVSAVKNNNSGKYRLSVNFLGNGENRLNVFVYDNTVSSLLENGTVLGLRYHELCNGLSDGRFCMQVNQDKLRVKRTNINVNSSSFNGNGYVEIRREINYNYKYYPTQKIYFQCNGNKPYSSTYNTNTNSNSSLDYIYNSLGNNGNNRNGSNGNNSNNNNNNGNNSNNTYNNYTYNTYNNTYSYNNTYYYTTGNNNNNENCSKEGEFSNGSVSPEYQKFCCAGLRSFNYQNPNVVGGSFICYNPERGTPTCQKEGTSREGLYYNNGDLLKYIDCYKTIPNQCTYNSDCKNGYVCNNGNCVYANQDCAKEGEISNASLGPNYYKPCCNGLRGFNYQNPNLIGAGLMCYDLNKGIPTCQKDGTSREGRYYTNGDLLKYMNCKINTNQCTYNSDCQNGYTCNNGNCVYANQDCVAIGITYNKTCCPTSILVRRGRDNTNRYCARRRP